MEDPKWCVEALADVFVWETTQTTLQYIKVMGDYGNACYLKAYLEENGYVVELEKVGIYSQLVIDR